MSTRQKFAYAGTMEISALFVPTNSLLDIVIRGSIVYLFLFAVFRFVRRGTGDMEISDILLVVLVADAVQNAMANEYKSITEGVVLVLTIAGWNILLDWLSYRYAFCASIIRAPALPLVENGRMLLRNMQAQLITRDELASQLRLAGVDDVSEVKRCCLEPDGKMSVKKYESQK